MPVIKLKTVVLPAPFGPITLTISCGQTSRSRSCTAARPPKRLETLGSFSRGSLRWLTACGTPIANSCPLLLNTHLRFETRRSCHHIQLTYHHAAVGGLTQLAPAPCTGNA